MSDHEPEDDFLERQGKVPAMPLLEALIVLIVFNLPVLLPLASHAKRLPVDPAYYQLSLLVFACMRITLVLYIMWRAEGLAAFGLRRLAWRDFPKGLMVALGACAAAAPLAVLFSLLGIVNPLIADLGIAGRSSATLIPFFVASSMATGYAEELFFRSYLMQRLGQAGLPPSTAAASACVLFGAAHLAQGVVGLVTALAIGAWFAWRWHKGRNIHEIAMGHGLYDSAIWAITLYS